jgi:hypothetical protein
MVATGSGTEVFLFGHAILFHAEHTGKAATAFSNTSTAQRDCCCAGAGSGTQFKAVRQTTVSTQQYQSTLKRRM